MNISSRSCDWAHEEQTDNWEQPAWAQQGQIMPAHPACLLCFNGRLCEWGESSAHYKDVKQCWPQHWPLGEAASTQLPQELCTSDHKSSSSAMQPAFHLPCTLHICLSSLARRIYEKLHWRSRSNQEAAGRGYNKGNPNQIKEKPNLVVVEGNWFLLGTTVLGDADNTISCPRPWATCSERATFQWRGGPDGWKAPRQVLSKWNYSVKHIVL